MKSWRHRCYSLTFPIIDGEWNCVCHQEVAAFTCDLMRCNVVCSKLYLASYFPFGHPVTEDVIINGQVVLHSTQFMRKVNGMITKVSTVQL